jgi:AraC family transcriptional regulator of adaptative response/methylated-DNA-[protein]-cysteine methyltransferase
MILEAPETHINYQRIQEAIHYLEQNFKRQPELDEVADKVHLSPYHFQRIFTAGRGKSEAIFAVYC